MTVAERIKLCKLAIELENNKEYANKIGVKVVYKQKDDNKKTMMRKEYKFETNK